MFSPGRGSWRSGIGFTLVEMLVVLAIVGVLAGLTVSGMQNTDSARLRNAQEILITQTQAARSLALARNAAGRLLIDAGSDEQNGRRRLLLVCRSQEDPSKWEVAAAPIRLPDQTAILVEDGQIPSSTGGSSTSPPRKMTGSEFLSQDSLGQSEWFFVEFDPAGTCEENAGAILLVGSARHDGNKWVRKSPEMIRGIMIRRSGQVGVFADTKHIGEAFGSP